MTSHELADTLDDRRLDPLLPLIEAVWRDGDLTDLEIAAVCMAVVRHPHLGLSCREALGAWLDPGHPPTPEELEALRVRLEQRATPESPS